MMEFAQPTFDEMIAAGRFDIVRPGVNPTAFPLDPGKFDDRFLQIVGFTGSLGIQKAFVDLTACGLRLALPEQLLAYIASHPEAHKSYAIVALGAVGLDQRQPPCVLRACHRDGKRVLETRPYKGPLETHERVLIAHAE